MENAIDPPGKRIGDRVRSLRIEQNLTLDDLADAVGRQPGDDLAHRAR
ncbi:MAG: hypothetical protein U5L46_12130 [Agrobacterium sp.]|nr:hypothetical protein [Agrobacterium sp.]